MECGTSRRLGAFRAHPYAQHSTDLCGACSSGCTFEHGGCKGTTICYDPHCALPACDAYSIQNVLTLGMAACEQASAPASMYPANNSCISTCSVPCVLEACPEPHCTLPQTASSNECISVCDGYLDGATACSSTCCDGTDLLWPSLPPLHSPVSACCAGQCTAPGDCTWASQNCAPTTVSSCYTGASAPCTTPSEATSSSGQSISTACSTPMQTAWREPPSRIPDIFSCQWAECDVQASTIEALAAHVRQTHAEQAQKWPAVLQAGSFPHLSSTTWEWPLPHDEHSSPHTPTAPKQESSSAAWSPLAELAYSADMAPLLQLDTACLCPPPAPGKKPHACGWEHCDQSFSTHAELTEHIARDHIGSGKNEYECRWVGCKRAAEGRPFSQRQKVLRHMQTHTGDRPYVCRVCDKRFSEPATLTQHMRIHTQERPYKCDFPGCNKSFSVAGSLTIHKRTHTGDRPFVCPIQGCGKQFAESSNLNKHMRIHRGDRPFQCPECGREFARLDQLGRHRKIHDAKRATSVRTQTEAPRAPVSDVDE